MRFASRPTYSPLDTAEPERVARGMSDYAVSESLYVDDAGAFDHRGLGDTIITST
jgi:hypothetical protein